MGVDGKDGTPYGGYFSDIKYKNIMSIAGLVDKFVR